MIRDRISSLIGTKTSKRVSRSEFDNLMKDVLKFLAEMYEDKEGYGWIRIDEVIAEYDISTQSLSHVAVGFQNPEAMDYDQVQKALKKYNLSYERYDLRNYWFFRNEWQK